MDEGVDALCQDYGVIHQFIALAWPKCNGMVEQLIQTIKHGLTILSSTNIQGWDIQLPRVLFGYCCGVQASMKYSPYMVLIGCSTKLATNNNLNGLCDVVGE